MVFLAGDPDITPITNLITTWIHIGPGARRLDRSRGFHLRVGVDVINAAVRPKGACAA